MSYYARMKAVERKAVKGKLFFQGRTEAYKQVFTMMYGREPTSAELAEEMQKNRKEPTRGELSEIAMEVERIVYTDDY